MSNERASITAKMPIDYILEGDKNSDELYVLLHGHAQNGIYILDKLRPVLKDKQILAPNAPFPFPLSDKKKSSFRVGFTWYFFDSTTNKFLIDFEFSANIISNLINELGLSNKKITIIGYSQGGYLSPFVAEKLNQVESVIGVACNFRHQYLKENLKCPLHAIHGSGDLIVEFNGAKESFTALKEMGNTGNFIALENEGHRLSDNYLSAIEKLL